MNLKLITVDDERYLHQGLDKLMNWEQWGISKVGMAYDGENAYKLIDGVRPDIIISDIRMPKLDGLNLIDKVNSLQNYHPHWIILSGYSDFAFAQQAMKFGVKHYLLKPVDPEEIKLALEQIRKESQFHSDHRQMDSSTRSFRQLIINHKIYDDSHLNEVLPLFRNLRYMQFMMRQEQPDQEEVLCTLLNKFNVPLTKQSFIRLSPYKTGFLLEDSLCSSKEVLSKLIHCSKREFKAEPYILLSPVLNTKEALRSSFQGIINSLACLPYTETAGLFYWTDQTQDIYSVKTPLKEALFFPELLNSIERGDQLEITKQLQQIRLWAYARKISLLALHDWIQCIVMDVTRIILELDGSVDGFMAHFRDPSYIEDLCYRKNVFDYMEQYSQEASQVIQELKRLNKAGVIMSVAKYVQEHYQESLSLKELGQIYSINPVYLGQLFKKTYSVSYKKYLCQIRMEEAQKLLASSDLKVYEVAHAVGYSDSDYFSEQFVKHTGVSPAKFRSL
ncbi:response regulator [Spirochaeta cellobiosiphila]|uniref:response regulator n=1 Tax=Spirochaeta cellobiosiphila TaxID=504483 RepID=UPI0003FD0190|nr:response regulator [Spirochaeta cellobiosiphila]